MIPDTVFRFLLAWMSCSLVHSALGVFSRPNIVIIMADDMGIDDVSFRGSNEFLTPNIDALAFCGIILNRYYVPPMCTPSRSALMTGKYPINLGMQHYVIANDEPWGLPLNEKILPEFFKEAGYFTSLIGKWHLGFAHKAYTPLYRGFDHHYGYMGGYIDYYDQTLQVARPYARGHDFRMNLNVTRANQGKYVTDSLTEEAIRIITNHDTETPLLMILSHLAPHTGNDDKPFQAPDEEIRKFEYIPDLDRRTYAAMVSKLDESVGKVVDTLHHKGILDNTIILFFSDNGAPSMGMHANKGSNYPLRGQKNSPWEGAVRTSAAIWSTLIGKHGRIWDQTVHVSDWLPTLASAAKISLDTNLNLNGLNLWMQLAAADEPAPRKLLHNIDDIFGYASYLSGEWKYVNGTTNYAEYDGWLTKRDDLYIDPRSIAYAESVKESLTWKTLAQYTPTQGITTDINELRQNLMITCTAEKEISVCRALDDECVFNIIDDPCEQNNLIDQMRNSKILRNIREEVQELRRNAKTPNNKKDDPKCDPKFYDYEWTWWKDIEE